jgi:hypothetical protein
MKKLILISACISLSLYSFSAVITASTNNGDWSVNSTWDLNRQPQIYDVVVIPANVTVTVTGILSCNCVTVKVYGILKFTGGKLDLTNNSVIYVYTGGKIKGSGSPSEQLRINNGKIWQGNNPDVIGSQMADPSTNGFVPFVVLPVKFLGFSLTRQNNDVWVQWSTSEEHNADLYQVERSTDGLTWNMIGSVKAAGNSTDINQYSFTDKNITKLTYYRIKEIDLDGRFSYTAVQSIRMETNATELKIAAVQNNILLQFPKQVKGSVSVQIISLGGQLIDRQTISNPVGQVILSTKARGNYIVLVSNGQDIYSAKQILL